MYMPWKIPKYEYSFKAQTYAIQENVEMNEKRWTFR